MDAIPLLGGWFYEEWSHLYADVERAIAERTNTNRIRLSLVAVEAGNVVDAVCLKVMLAGSG